jgi:putative molybdopterin biosynthesis protein
MGITRRLWRVRVEATKATGRVPRPMRYLRGMQRRGIHLQYGFEATGQRGADVQNPLFDLLHAVREHGSIQQAATAMGTSYRHTWGQLKHWEAVMGEPLLTWTQGQPARLTPFAERLLWAESRARTRLTPHIEALRAELERVLAEALDGSQQVLAVHASHDLALPLLRQSAGQQHGLHLDLRFAGSLDALRALAEGRCLVAGFHVPPLEGPQTVFARGLKPLLQPGRHKLIGCMRRRQGLMVPKANPLGLSSLFDVPARGARLVQRQPGSGTRLLTDHLCAAQGLGAAAWRSCAGSEEDSHVAVAAAVASGLGDVGIGIEAAAHAFGLGFVPLIEEDYFLVCLAETLEHPAVRLLREVLAGPDWRAALASLPGYTPARAGEVLSLTRALPWWRFAKPKAQAGPKPSHDPS